MQFTSFDFVFFVLIVLFVASFFRRITPAASAALGLFFYASFGWFLPLLAVISSLFDYLIVKKITDKSTKTKYLLALGVALNLSFLAGVKISYWGGYDLLDNGSSLVPIGISFYTLQSISFLVDVYKKKLLPPETYVEYLSYILFFPQLLAGPIERATSLLPQLRASRVADFENIRYGLKLFLAGCFLKVVIANRLADPSVTVANSSEIDLVFLANGLISMFYVYSDFFGYTLMARGIAKFFSIDLHINFNRPFAAKNLTGFWQNWHMSLTKWIGDYFYIPIMLRLKNKSFAARLIFGVFSMVLIGLWHGIGWNFVLFGLVHGICMQVSNYIVKNQNKNNLPSLLFNETAFFYMVLFLAGNFFHITSTEKLLIFLNVESYTWVSLDNLENYLNPSVYLGCVALIPLLYFEFVDNRFLKEGRTVRHDIILIGFFLLAIIFAHKLGGGHVYFAF